MRAACDSTARAWRALGTANVRQVDSTLRTVSESTFVAGCTVVAFAARGIDTLQAGRLYWKPDTTTGWVDRWDYSADGPNGGVRTYDRGGIRCEVEISVAGHDDSDTTFVPAPWIRERTHCFKPLHPIRWKG